MCVHMKSITLAATAIVLFATRAFAQQPASLDLSFDPGQGASNFDIHAVVLQPAGEVLIGGEFTQYDGTARSGIARLHSDGSLDDSFDPGTGVNNGTNPHVRCIALQNDGKVLIGGDMSSYNGTPRNGVARLNDDGTLDTSFDPGDGVGSILGVYCIVLQPDGKILIGGGFSYYGDIPRKGIARLNEDGSLDLDFDPGLGVDGVFSPNVSSIVLQPDGMILIGGSFTTYNGTARNYIARLNPDGSMDGDFDPGVGANGSVRSMVLQTDNRVLVGGVFSTFDDTPRSRIARLNSDGTLDLSFDPGTGTNGFVLATLLQPNGKVLISGTLTTCNGIPRNRIARLNSDGSLDLDFDPGVGPAGGLATTVSALANQPDGKLLIGGGFTTYNGIPRNRIARLMGDGFVGIPESLDLSNYIQVWPNPAHEELFLSVPADGWVKDLQGRIIRHFDRDNVVDLSDIAPGPYMLCTTAALAVRIVVE